MKIRFRVGMVAASAWIIFAAGAVAFAQDKSDVIKTRHDFMESQQKAVNAVAAFGKGTGDRQGAIDGVNTLLAKSTELGEKLAAFFPPGTSMVDFPGKTYAKPEIWQEFDKFQAMPAKLHDAELELLDTVKTADAATVGAAMSDALSRVLQRVSYSLSGPGAEAIAESLGAACPAAPRSSMFRSSFVVLALLALSAQGARADDAATARGAYLAAAGDCEACHTDKKANGKPFAGGRALVTAFGTFYAPNITPDPRTGIGKWSEADFHRALREGKNEHGAYYYPAFPFPSFTNMTDADISDLYAFLTSLPPVQHREQRNEVMFPLGWRFLMIGWRTLFFSEGPIAPVAGQSEEWNRGRYLAEAVVHCEECHTPRNFLGALDHSHAFAGNPHGPDKQDAPDITSDKKDGIGDWSVADVEEVLELGDDARR